jgi:hypothetical protein
MQRAIEIAIDEIGLPSTSEDIADFLREALPDLETKRRDAITKALGAAETRDGGPITPHPISAASPEDAFAPTVATERAASSPRAEPEAVTIALTKKKAPPPSSKKKRSKTRTNAGRDDESKLTAAPPTRGDESKLTAAPPARDDESKLTAALSARDDAETPPPKRRTGLWVAAALLAACAAAWFVWPGGDRLRDLIAPTVVPEPSADVSAPPTPSRAVPAVPYRSPAATSAGPRPSSADPLPSSARSSASPTARPSGVTAPSTASSVKTHPSGQPIASGSPLAPAPSASTPPDTPPPDDPDPYSN